MSTPKVSVVMSVFNGIPYLREAVESLLGQTYSEFEFIIIDDASTDDTWSLLSEFAAKDERIVLYRNEQNLGLTRSLNRGIKLARGKYIARQDADDISLTIRFERQVEVLDTSPEVVLVSSDIEIISPEGKPKKQLKRACSPLIVSWNLIFCNYVGGHSQVMFRRSSAIDVGGYPEHYRYSQDYALWCHLSKLGNIVILPEILLKQRVHEKSISSVKKKEQETFALTQAKYNIKQLIDMELTLDEIVDIRAISMIPDAWIEFFDSLCFSDRKIHSVHIRLWKIYQAFLAHAGDGKSSDYKEHLAEIKRELRSHIGRKFLLWVQILSIRKNPMMKLRVSVYAFCWSPLGLISYWTSEFRRILRSVFTLLPESVYKNHSSS